MSKTLVQHLSNIFKHLLRYFYSFSIRSLQNQWCLCVWTQRISTLSGRISSPHWPLMASGYWIGQCSSNRPCYVPEKICAGLTHVKIPKLLENLRSDFSKRTNVWQISRRKSQYCEDISPRLLYKFKTRPIKIPVLFFLLWWKLPFTNEGEAVPEERGHTQSRGDIQCPNGTYSGKSRRTIGPFPVSHTLVQLQNSKGWVWRWKASRLEGICVWVPHGSCKSGPGNWKSLRSHTSNITFT